MTTCRGSLSITWAHNFVDVSSPVEVSLIRGEYRSTSRLNFYPSESLQGGSFKRRTRNQSAVQFTSVLPEQFARKFLIIECCPSRAKFCFLATHLLIPSQHVTIFLRVLDCTMTTCRGSLSITWAHNFVDVSSPVGISLIRGESEYK